MFYRFIVSAAVIGALGLGAGAGVYSYKKVQQYKDEIINLQNFCESQELAANFATVERVVDGDTIKLTNGKSIRLIGPDTPEICHYKNNGELRDPECKDEFYGLEAKDFLTQLVTDREIILIGDPEVGSYDNFGRPLRYVYLKDRFINLELVELGYAPVYERLLHRSKFYEDFQTAEAEARTAGLGVWSEKK